MTTESKAHAAKIKARREAVGISFEGFYDGLGLNKRQGEWVENGQYGKNITEFRGYAEKYLDQLEAKKAGLPPPIYTSNDVPAGLIKEIMTKTVDEYSLTSTPAPAPEYKAHRMINDKKASQKQLEKFADGLCQAVLKSGHNLVTIPWAEFYELLYAATGCGHFDQTLLDSIFSNLTCCSVPFLISFGNNVVVVSKDALFAPVEYP